MRDDEFDDDLISIPELETYMRHVEEINEKRLRILLHGHKGAKKLAEEDAKEKEEPLDFIP